MIRRKPLKMFKNWIPSLEPAFELKISKNALSRHNGFSPEQTVLGKSTKVPASLTSGEQGSSHSLADGSDLDCGTFRRNLEVRTRARKMFLLADNDSAIRGALLRKSCPPVDTYVIGQHVMYWRKRNTFGRREIDRWHGPARIVCQDGSTTMWIAHGDKLLRCAPENLRPASLREWGSISLDQQVQNAKHESTQWWSAPWIALRNECFKNSRGWNLLTRQFCRRTSHACKQPDQPEPESELLPETLTNPVNTPATGPQNHPNENSPPPHESSENSNDNAIDLDAPEDHAIDLDASDDVLTCHDVCNLETDETIHERNVFHAGTAHSQMCLAEDGMPYIENPPQPQDHLCVHAWGSHVKTGCLEMVSCWTSWATCSSGLSQ